MSNGRHLPAVGHFRKHIGIAFTPDGRRLITAHGTHALVWEVGK